MSRHALSQTDEAVLGPSRIDGAAACGGLVGAAFDDSWSSLDAEVALIDRLFGGEIAALFERRDDGCVYARVSTSRQEKNDLSLPYQIASADAGSRKKGRNGFASSPNPAVPPPTSGAPFAR